MNPGLVMAASYSMRPNELGNCGVKDAFKTLHDFVLNPDAFNEADIRRLLETFEFASSYYRVIATANNIEDIFDEKAVEAYWIGNSLLEQVNIDELRLAIEKDLTRDRWTKGKIEKELHLIAPNNVRAHHSMSALYYIKKPNMTPAMKTHFDECRVGWGEITSVHEEDVEVLHRPLVFDMQKKIDLAWPEKKFICKGFLRQPKIGQIASFHLNYGIQILSTEQEKNLSRVTGLNIAAFNE